LATSFVQKGVISSPAVLEYVVPFQTVCCTHLMG
jgi:hypothetical protein